MAIEVRAAEVATLPRVFQTTLISIDTPSDTETTALRSAIDQYARRTVRDDFSALENFLEAYPNGSWSASIHAGLGGECFTVGRYSRALEHWRQAWTLSHGASGREAVALADKSLTELALMLSRLGRREELRELLKEGSQRRPLGTTAVKLDNAVQGLEAMDTKPDLSYRCGPLALSRILAYTHPGREADERIRSSDSPDTGFSLAAVSDLAGDLGMKYQMAFRTPGSAVVLPAVIHWKVGHYAALLKERKGLHLAQDPTFGREAWLSISALDDEASGYFLVPAGPLPKGWRRVDEAEGKKVFGKGTTADSDPDSTNPYDETAYDRNRSCGLATWNIGLLLINQIITDTPLGYTPPFGPPVYFTATYNSLDQGLPGGAAVSRLGHMWSYNWLSFITEENFNEFATLLIYAPGGGTLRFPSLNETNQSFYNEFYGRGTLFRVSSNRFEYRFPEGTKWVFSKPDGSVGTTRRIFMTELVDPAGNAATLEYDANLRLTRVRDALGQPTVLEYGVSTNYYDSQFLVSKVTDPFGRFATFQYDSRGFMTNIVDVLGMSSTFVYGGPYFDRLNQTNFDRLQVFGSRGGGRPPSGGWIPTTPYNRFLDGITELHTPYGVTQFRRGYGFSAQVWMEVTGPDGATERFEYNESNSTGLSVAEPLWTVPRGMGTQNNWLYARNSIHWDKKAYAESYRPNDFTGARIYHFTHALTVAGAGPIIESVKLPLEGRVWFNYPGQSTPWFAGRSDQPTKIGRVLDDGTTQLHHFEYNEQGNVTKSIDPVGRTFTFVYETNGIDLREIRQTRAGQNELLARATYNPQHRPLTITDTAGQTTIATYNSRGQLLTLKNAKNETRTFTYDTNGYLIAIDDPLPGTNDQMVFTYDTFGRVQTLRDASGYILTFDYDSLDRLTGVHYPDGTSQEWIYDRLDLSTYRDRLGRETQYIYNSMRQLTEVHDSLDRVTRLIWCRCGQPESVIDALGRLTTWERDIQGRVTSKIYPDGSRISYEYEPMSGRLASIRDEKAQLTLLSYNLDDTLRQQSYRNTLIPTPAVTFTYDPNYERVASMRDGIGLTTYNYYPITTPPLPGANRLASIDGPLDNDTVVFTYDQLGRLSERRINGVALSATWDPAGRLSRTTNILGTFDFTYDGPSRRLASIHYPNGQLTTLSYYTNAIGYFLREIGNVRGDASLLSKFVYQYDPAGQITNWMQYRASGTPNSWDVGYDLAGQLKSVGITQGGSPIESYLYTYDSVGNRISEQTSAGLRTFQYNALNEIAEASTGVVASATYEWDAAQRLVAITLGTNRTEFSYDGLDRRVRVVEWNGSVSNETRFLWCGSRICEERDATGSNVTRRLFDLGEQIVSGPLAGKYYYTQDHLGSIREIVNNAGGTEASYEYDPFGTRRRTTGSFSGSFGFTGHYFHERSQLYLAPYRAYDPGLARWISRDLIGEGGGVNLYAYVDNDPVNWWDPLGLIKLSAEFQAKYPKSAARIQSLADRLSPKAFQGFKRFGKASKKQVRQTIASPDRGPTCTAEDFDGNTYGSYNRETKILRLRTSLLERIERGEKFEFLFDTTVEHELVHYFDDVNNNNRYPGEEGEAYEEWVYGAYPAVLSKMKK
jgi:RHS repeat-associated protein